MGVFAEPFTSFGTMESKKAKQEFDFKVRLRMPPELVKWLIGAILMGGGALTAATHWGNVGCKGRAVRCGLCF